MGRTDVDGESTGGLESGRAHLDQTGYEELDQQWTTDRIAELKCMDRGEGRKPMHIYLDSSGECQCKQGPRLSEQRMK